MQKFFRLTVFLLSVLSMLVLPLQWAFCADRFYYISNYKIYVTIHEDGSADIEEQLNYSFTGQFNGILRDVDFSGTGGLAAQKVFVDKAGSLVEYQQNESNSFDAQGQPGTYNLALQGDQAHFKVFEPSSNERKTFIIKYRLLDAVTRYNDVATFNRKIIDEGWETRLDNVYIQVILPEGAAPEELKVFGHGPLTGESRIVDGKTLEFTAPSVSPGTFVETLVIFPPGLVPNSRNTVDRDELPEIMKNEGKQAEEANKIREEARQQVARQEEMRKQQAEEQRQRTVYGAVISVLLILLWFYVIIAIYVKYDKELKHNFEGKYYRELPGEYTPAEMSVLLSFGYTQSRDIMATLMDLIRKKQLELTSAKQTKKGLFGSKETVEYVISVNSNAPYVTLKKHESFLMDWFIGKIGDGASVSLDEIKSYVQSSKRALQFKEDYDKWGLLVKKEAEKNNFFDDTSKKGRTIGVLTGLAYIAAGILTGILLNTGIAFILTVPGIILLIFSARIKRCTAYGSEQRAMWNAFKNFLKDFSNMEKAVIPSIVLWEHYLVYAISLGVAREVIKQLPLVFTDYDLNDSRLTYMHGTAYGYFAGFHTMFDNTIHTVEGAITSAVSVANSANSSSSGSGGGFSGGSSGGGGGGGGGGAF